MRETGFEPDEDIPARLASLVARDFQGSNPRSAFAAHGLFAAKCAGPDLNREDFALLVLWAANPVLLFAHFVRSCAGPDLNRRTPTG